MSVITLLYAVVLPLLSKRYAAKWRYMVWLVIAAGWLFPIRPEIDLSFFSTQMTGIPVTPIRPIMNATPSVFVTGDIVNVPDTIPLWLVLAAIWILGVGSAMLYHTLQYTRFIKMVRRWSELVTDLEILATLDSMKVELKIKTQVEVRVCPGISSPMLIGFCRPVILLPPDKIAVYELPFILKHELIHFKRHDLWFKTLILAAVVFHWFNPVVYFMARFTAVQCEISCDALVLRDADFIQRKQYGETIIGVVRNGAKLQTALSTNFYGGKKDMKNRICSIMDTKRKKAGIVILCVTLAGIMMTGARLAASADEEKTNGPVSKNVAIAEENMETPESIAERFAVYEQFGISYNKSTDQLFYNGELVRYFEDYYPVGGIEEDTYSGIDYLNENGTIDVHGIRDLSNLTRNTDGAIDPGGKLTGVERYSQAEFDARDIEVLKNPPMEATSGDETSTTDNSSMAQETAQSKGPASAAISSEGGTITPEELAELYAVYEPFGLTYDIEQDCLYYNGKRVRQFIDILTSNGESLTSGKFKGSMRQINSPDGKGEVDVYTVRNYKKTDTNGNGTLTDVKAYSQEEFDARTED